MQQDLRMDPSQASLNLQGTMGSRREVPLGMAGSAPKAHGADLHLRLVSMRGDRGLHLRRRLGARITALPHPRTGFVEIERVPIQLLAFHAFVPQEFSRAMGIDHT